MFFEFFNGIPTANLRTRQSFLGHQILTVYVINLSNVFCFITSPPFCIHVGLTHFSKWTFSDSRLEIRDGNEAHVEKIPNTGRCRCICWVVSNDHFMHIMPNYCNFLVFVNVKVYFKIINSLYENESVFLIVTNLECCMQYSLLHYIWRWYFLFTYSESNYWFGGDETVFVK